ncbi:hypothetical protein COT72_03255 [archaeon CG10_big_fil_rev_8_21_14_0_10_43_11]|nr:MAG: hypothetical protein COT72_03255 [archaeon CG10_big_fil_rev_8_21_14_0_10_43_11]
MQRIVAKVALAQIELFDELKKNVSKVLEYIEKAAFKDTDIVCFPESCLGEDFLDMHCKEIEQIKASCKKNNIYAIIGAHIKEGEKVSNVAILINRTGNIAYVYRKVHLFPGLDLGESVPGTDNHVVETDFGKIGIIIC